MLFLNARVSFGWKRSINTPNMILRAPGGIIAVFDSLQIKPKSRISCLASRAMAAACCRVDGVFVENARSSA